MKHINTYLICVLIILLIYSIKNTNQTINIDDNKHIKKTFFNYNTQKIEPFRRIGVLYKNDSNDILPLYGRRTHVRSSTWNYYTTTNDNNNIKIEVNIKNRQCLRNTGCKELHTGDTIHIPEYNGVFTVNLYL